MSAGELVIGRAASFAWSTDPSDSVGIPLAAVQLVNNLSSSSGTHIAHTVHIFS